MAKKIRIVIPSEAQMRTAIRQRDSRADGNFLFGVISTGIYCLPSCPSRPANEGNLRFFLTPESAQAAGFRPCRRCRPTQTLAERDSIEAAARAIIAAEDRHTVLSFLAKSLGISESASRKRFTRWLGISPKALTDATRHHALKLALREGSSVIAAINEAGFGSTRSAYEQSQSLGMTPSTYRAGGRSEQISFATRKTSYGVLMLAATDSGVCFCQFGDSEAQLRRELAKEFPNAGTSPAGDASRRDLDAWVQALQSHLDSSGPMPDVPLDLRGSISQIRAWKFLLSLPEGSTVSYAELARAIDSPKAHRAAASACAANRVALLVPCHRVLRGDGSPGGYRWGAERKLALLAHERKAARRINSDPSTH